MANALRSRQVKRTKRRSSASVILIGEDDEPSRSMMRAILEMKGYVVVEAKDGEQVIESACSDCPGLILLDFSLPGLNGLEVTRELRKNQLTRSVPIIMVSGWDDPTHKSISLNAGCNEYFLKPIDVERLEVELKRYLPLNSKKSFVTRSKSVGHS